jgi:ethanolamine utilization protein EutQ (cupin superfamily)
VKKLEQEQEGIIEDAIEHIIIEDHGVDSSEESCDMSEMEGQSGAEALEAD